MPQILQELEKYYYKVFGDRPRTRPWREARTLPLFLREGYDFHEVTLSGVPCLLAVDLNPQERSPAKIAKQIAQVRQRANRHVVYARASVTSYNRQRLVRQKLPFVVPGSQLYLPMLGTDLRERFGAPHTAKPTLSPATQVLVLNALYRKDYGPLTPGRMADLLGYAPMTMTRAFRELETLGIGNHRTQGKNRRLDFPAQGRELWEKLLPYLCTPVKRTFYAERGVAKTKFPVAGLTALARYTMIGEPPTPVVACTVRSWKTRPQDLAEVPYPDESSVQVEMWKYSPELYGESDVVDQLSLFLSLRDERDERIGKALDEMMEHFPW